MRRPTIRAVTWMAAGVIVASLVGGGSVSRRSPPPDPRHQPTAADGVLQAPRLDSAEGVVTVAADPAARFVAPRSPLLDRSGAAAAAPASRRRALPVDRAHPVGWGLYDPELPLGGTALAAAHAAGRAPQYVMWYVHWGGSGNEPDPGLLESVEAAGATPLITWMSDDPGHPAAEQSLTQIADGADDAYLRAWGSALARLDAPVLLRFDPEMNGNWFPWAPAGSNTTPAEYVRAWRHVHDVVTAAGARDVQWVWSPNVQYTGSTPLPELYPGDAYVDWLGLDGYNWGPAAGHSWQSPAQVFAPSLQALGALSDRPMMLAEVGTTGVGGNKAQWIGDFFSFVRSQSRLRAFVWFDADKETDWRYDDDAADLAAFSAGLAATS